MYILKMVSFNPVSFFTPCGLFLFFVVDAGQLRHIPTSVFVDFKSETVTNISNNLDLLVGRTVLDAEYFITCDKNQSISPLSSDSVTKIETSEKEKQPGLFTIYLISSCNNTFMDNKESIPPSDTAVEATGCLSSLVTDGDCSNESIPVGYIDLQTQLSTLLLKDERNYKDVSVITAIQQTMDNGQTSVADDPTGMNLHLTVSNPSLFATPGRGVQWQFSSSDVVYETKANCKKACSKDLQPEGRVIYFNGTSLDVTSPMVTGSYWRCVVKVKHYIRNQDVALVLKVIQDNHVWTRRLNTKESWKVREEHIGMIQGAFQVQLQFYRNQQIVWKIGKLQSVVFDSCYLPPEPSKKPIPGPSNDTFVCRTGVAIKKKALCDFHNDCFHGDDESEELCGNGYSLGLCDFEEQRDCPFIHSDYRASISTIQLVNVSMALTSYTGSFEDHILAYEEKHSSKQTGFVTVNLTNLESVLTDNQSCEFHLDAYLGASNGRFRLVVHIIDSLTDDVIETDYKTLKRKVWQRFRFTIPDLAERNVTTFYLVVFTVLSKGEFLGVDKVYLSPQCILQEPSERHRSEIPSADEENDFILIAILTSTSVAAVWITVLLLLYRRYIKLTRSGVIGKRLSLFGERTKSLKCLHDSAPLLRRLNDNLCQDHPNFHMYKEILTQDLNDDIKNLSRYKLRLTNVLGSGAFGEVLQGQLIKGAFLKHVAVKRLSNGCSEKERTDFLVEALTMSKFKHNNIVCCLGIYIKNGCLLLVEELMIGGDLKRFLVESRPTVDETPSLGIDELLSLANDICQACSYLEANKFIHRDIASRNCLLTTKASDRVAKIADFGLARDIIHNDSYKKCGRSMLPVRWLPPESYLEGMFTTKSDVWAYGILLWEIFSFGYDPYPGMKCEEMMAKVNNGVRMDAPLRCPAAMYDVMILCWQHDPKSRPSFQRLCEYIEKIRKNVYISITSDDVSGDENDKEDADEFGNTLPIWQYNGNYAIEEESV